MSSIFQIYSSAMDATGKVFSIEPYRFGDAWVFDDARVGLVKEPFVEGVTEMIDRLVAEIPNAAAGFRLLFALSPFDGHQATLEWVRSDPVEGNWYRDSTTGSEGWLCPAMFWYFPTPPEKIYVRAEQK